MSPKEEIKGAVIAIDGPSGVGKTSVSKRVAKELGFRYVDTGSMYRALAVAAHNAGIDPEDAGTLENFARRVKIHYDTATGAVFIDGKDYTGLIRTESAGALASLYSSKPAVRGRLVEYQRQLGRDGSVVMEGRDIGTVVFKDADLKFFLDASHDVRANRRALELNEKNAPGVDVSARIRERDDRDSSRKVSPLRMADDAVYVDTGALDLDGVVKSILKIIRERLGIGDTRS